MASSGQSTVTSDELIIDRPGYTIRFEYDRNYVILHLLDIEKFTKETFLDMVGQLETWSRFLRAMGRTTLWAAVAEDNTKIKRLLGGLRFKFAGRSDGMTVYKYEV